jgi:hypothetical protein
MKREKTVKIGVTIWNGHTYCSSGQQERALSVSSGPLNGIENLLARLESSICGELPLSETKCLYDRLSDSTHSP